MRGLDRIAFDSDGSATNVRAMLGVGLLPGEHQLARRRIVIPDGELLGIHNQFLFW